MSSTLSVPWYRHFWPWFLVAMLGCAVAGSFISLYFALHTTDAVVEHADASQ